LMKSAPQVGDTVTYEDHGYQRTGTVNEIRPYRDGSGRHLLDMTSASGVRWIDTWDPATMTVTRAA
jgi:hypothetical protein